MTQKVLVEFDNDIAIVRVDSPPVNATSTAVRQGLVDAVKEVEKQSLKAAILVCEGKTFIAGGDMTEFDVPAQEPHLPDVVDLIENSKVPYIAAMHGTVLGGGFEIAMGCAFRIALAGTKCGLPEVNVGLIPGAGGTQRLPRLVGPKLATEMVTDGLPRPVEMLFEKGAIDKIVDEDLLKHALQFARGEWVRPEAVSLRGVEPVDDDFFSQKRAALIKRSKGQQSQLHNLDAIEWARELLFNEGQPKERALHLSLRKSNESRALRHMFFAQKQASSPESIKNCETRQFDNIAVIGGGLMGTGICFASLMAGCNVVLIENNDEALENANKRILGLIKGALKRGKLNQSSQQDLLERFSLSLDYQHLSEADIIIEAVYEDLETKQSVFKKIAEFATEQAILATNTSYLNPDEIFSDVPHPERCLGLHFFAPAHIMKLVEVVKTKSVAKDVLATGFAFAKRLKKLPVLSGISDGFIGNRILAAYRRQADYLLADGCLPHEIDEAMRKFGMPMGPYELQDMSGLQIGWSNRKRQAATRPPNERYVTIADQVCEAGWLGQQTGKGWYSYENGKKSTECTPEVENIIKEYSEIHSIIRSTYTSDEIASRMIAVMVNEGALIVEEDIASNFDDVDVVQVLGFGFPRWRGGPMKYAEILGLKIMKEAMKRVESQSPKSWQRSERLS